jgi:hypothetical protein
MSGRVLVFSVHMIHMKISLFSLSSGACLREAASAKAGERVGVRGKEKTCDGTRVQ